MSLTARRSPIRDSAPGRFALARPLNASNRCCRGIAMLEVVFALSLFAAAVAVICGSFSASANAVSRMQLHAVADNLAVTLLSQMQLGIVPSEDDGPYGFEEPFADWTWEVVTAEMNEVIDIDGPVLMSVEIIIRHIDGDCTRRLTVLVPDTSQDDQGEIEEDAP